MSDLASKEVRMKTVYVVKDTSVTITLTQNEDMTFNLDYGHDHHVSMSYSKAAQKLGRALLHALAYDGKIEVARKCSTPE